MALTLIMIPFPVKTYNYTPIALEYIILRTIGLQLPPLLVVDLLIPTASQAITGRLSATKIISKKEDRHLLTPFYVLPSRANYRNPDVSERHGRGRQIMSRGFERIQVVVIDLVMTRCMPQN